MATLQALAQERTDLTDDDIRDLQALVAEWSVLADLSFSDVVLWLPTWNDGGFVAAAQVRPTTGPTTLPQDVVGQFNPKGRRPHLDKALLTKTAVTARHEIRPLIPQSDEAFPILRRDRVIGIVQRLAGIESRVEGLLETHYLETFDALASMAMHGSFPFGEGIGRVASPPRVGDGLLRLDNEGVVVFASPNAVSACHRLGLAFGIEGQHLANTLMRLTRRPGPANESLMLVAGGRTAGETEFENAGAVMALRSMPLEVNQQRMGAVVLLRDVSEIRRRESSLLTKDATIREIHHRVKNNLQTVAALLRLQARRSESDEVKVALEEAQRRVAAIATVHETLAHEPGTFVDFNEVMERLGMMLRDMTRDMRRGSIHFEGNFGVLRSEQATALAMAMTELMSNAIEHGIALRETDGRIDVRARRTKDLEIEIVDDGPGLSGDAIEEGLGLSIVRTIVTQDLRGSLDIANRTDSQGVHVRLKIPLNE